MPGKPRQGDSPEERATLKTLHAQGHGRNEIARRMKLPQKVVTRMAQEESLSFERSGATAAATKAKQADAAANRARLQTETLAAALRLSGQMFEPSTVYNFGGRENEYNERTLPEPPFSDKRAIAVAVQALASTALRLAEFDRGSDNQDQGSILLDLRDQLRAARDAARGQGDES